MAEMTQHPSLTPSAPNEASERPTIVKLVRGSLGPLALNFLLVDSPEGKAAQCLEIDVEVTGYSTDAEAIRTLTQTITDLIEDALTHPEKLRALFTPAPRPVWEAAAQVLYADKATWLDAIRRYRAAINTQALPSADSST